MGGVVAGPPLPRWQVQQVTIWAPPKLLLLMPCIIEIILRATCLRGMSLSHWGSDPPAPTWQSPQQTFRAAEKRPMVPMNSSTVRPLSTWTFLKTSSAICGLACARATPPNGTVAPSSANAPVNIRFFDENFILGSTFYP